MFFKAITPFLKHGPLTILVSMNGEGKITACFIPKPDNKGAGDELKQPFSLTGSADEIDAHCDAGIAQLSHAYASLAEQVAAAKAVMDAASKARTEAATKAVKAGKPATASRQTTSAVRVSASSPVESVPEIEEADDNDEDGRQGNAAPNVDADAESPAKGEGLFEGLSL